MNSSQSALWLTSDELSSSSVSDHLHDLEVALLPPLIAMLSQHVYLTLLSLHVSLVTGIAGLAPMCLVEFLPLIVGLVPMYSVEFPPLSFLPLQCL